jgi:hypothetical protein
MPPNSANTLHKHIRSEEFFLSNRHGLPARGQGNVNRAALANQEQLREMFIDTDAEVL